jgi:hypothetical protein
MTMHACITITGGSKSMLYVIMSYVSANFYLKKLRLWPIEKMIHDTIQSELYLRMSTWSYFGINFIDAQDTT